jgi:aldose 1-epimerase
MSTNQQFCFTHSTGEDIYLFALRNKDTEVLISNYGAIINSFKIKQTDGSINDIVLGFDSMEEYLSPAYLAAYPWFGAAVGRYANRIKNSSFTIDGKKYPLFPNNEKDHLHGGKEGFDKKVWELVSFDESPHPALVLKHTSPGGDEGYPGKLVTTIRYELNNERNELSYEFNATTDQLTPVNLTHHGYFNLDTNKKTIGDHIVRIYASQVLEQGENFVATGNYIPVAGTSYDFTEAKKINRDWNPEDGYDQSYITAKKDKTISLVAEAWSEQSKLHLEVWSTEPVVHFYTGKWIPKVKGKQGVQYGPYSAFCMETQVHPNAVNVPHFPTTLLKPGETYYQKTVYIVRRES